MAHVEKRGPRKYRARHRGPDGKERSRTFATERDAKKWLTSVEHSKEVGSYVDPKRSRVTLGEWADEWRAGRVHLKPSTLASYDSLLKTQIRPTWESIPLARVSHAEVVAWVASMRKTGLSASR